MIRGPQILTWSGLLRPLREFHVAAGCEHTGTGWLDASVVKDKGYKVIHGYKEVPLFSTETLSFSTHLSLHSWNCDNQESGAIFCNQDHHPAQVSPSAKVKLGCNSQKCTAVEDLSQNLKAVSILNYLINTACLQARRRTTQCNLLQSHSYHRQHFIRAFSLSAHQPWILNRFHCKHKPSSCCFQLTRAACQTPVAGTWRDCLSSENESRCRQSLGPNLKLYETDKRRKWLSRGKNQAKWASVLVSLCSVKGEPAFLFTLRSSMLKGRHKGDVSFAGGKNDPSDRDVVATALREATEELGINVATECVWGILKPLNDVSGMMIAPVLANLGPLEELCFKPNPGEVEEIFTLSLSHLCNPQNRGYTHFRTGEKYGYTLPVFRNGKHRVWGLTAVALDHTLKLIVPRPPSQ